MHACKSCEEVKPATEFRVHKRGYRIGSCKPCERAYQRAWSERDPETYRRRKRESMARRRGADPEAVRDYQRKDYEANREARTATMREYTQRRFFWTKATKLKGDGKAGARDLARMWRLQRGRWGLESTWLSRTASNSAAARAGACQTTR